MKRRQMPVEPWVDVAVDFMGPLPSGDYILVIIDYFSRYKEIKFTENITATNTIKILQEVFSRLGYPASITNDSGRQFNGVEMRTFCKEWGIKLFLTIPYWPQQNGEVERQNRDILKRLRISPALKTDWKQELLDYLVMYNSTPHSTTGKTPSEPFFRGQFRDKLPNLGNSETLVFDEEARDRDLMEKEKGKQYADRKRKAATDDRIQERDKVYSKNMVRENKLTPNFKAKEYTVVSKKGGDTTIKDSETGQELRRNMVHLKRVEGKWEVVNNPEEPTMKGARELEEHPIAPN